MRKTVREIRKITSWCYYCNVDLVGVYYSDCLNEAIIKN
nr:MAG TPA: coiled coil protein [Caudoviricetes sp.]